MTVKIVVLLLLVASCGLLLCYDDWFGQQRASVSVATDDTHYARVPDFIFTTRDGRSRHMHDMTEPGVILHFWASNCAPCLVELPQLLQRVAAANGKLALIAVSNDDDRAAMNRFIAKQDLKDDLHVHWVWDEDKAISLKIFNTLIVPETILIDAGHQMVDKIVGNPDWTRDDMQHKLEALILHGR